MTPSSSSDSALVQALERAISQREARLPTPALVIDLDRVDHNIQTVVARLGGASNWRPDVSACSEARLVRRLMEKGIDSFQCTTLHELALAFGTAERVDPDGRVDVLLATPPTRPVLEAALALLDDHEGATLRILADAPEHLSELLQHPRLQTPMRRISLMLEVDVGLHRTGSSAATWSKWFEDHPDLRKRIAGLRADEGHLRAGDKAAVAEVREQVVALAAALQLGKKSVVVSSGSATCMAAAGSLPGLKAQHQVAVGSVMLADLETLAKLPELGLLCAAFVLARVVSCPGEDRVTLDAGITSLTFDRESTQTRLLAHHEAKIVQAGDQHLVVTTSERLVRNDRVWLVPANIRATLNRLRQAIFVRGERVVAS